MSLLLSGLCLWAGVHLFPSLATRQRTALIDRLGLGPYKSLFALCIVFSLVLIVFGWRSIDPVQYYQLPFWSRYLTFMLVLLTFILFVAARTRNNFKRYLRHPQLTGVVFWSAGHLLANGDSRSVLLFGFIGTWALLEMIMINRREGVCVKPEAVLLRQDIRVICAGIVLFSILWWLHPYFSGVYIAI